MKKFLIALLLCTLVQTSVLANVKFVYINGSNNNTKEMKDWFFDGIKKLHPVMKAEFEKSELINSNLLKGEKIDEEPLVFFWGDKSAIEVEKLNEELAISSLVSTKVAQMVRNLIAHSFHDAIWVQKQHNMHPVLDDLHEELQSEVAKGNKVILFGYSAGSFVAYQYLLQKMPSLDVEKFSSRIALTNEEKEFMQKNKIADTCLDALVDSEMVVFSTEGKLVINRDKSIFKKQYRKIDEHTKKSCSISGNVKGIVNYASPIPLFYSDMADPNFVLNTFNLDMYEYLIENDMFYLTVNFREDPLGYPVAKNYSVNEAEKLFGATFEQKTGFFYDSNSTRSGKSFISAHLSYWKKAKTFSKAVVKAYEDGYANNFGNQVKELIN